MHSQNRQAIWTLEICEVHYNRTPFSGSLNLDCMKGVWKHLSNRDRTLASRHSFSNLRGVLSDLRWCLLSTEFHNPKLSTCRGASRSIWHEHGGSRAALHAELCPWFVAVDRLISCPLVGNTSTAPAATGTFPTAIPIVAQIQLVVYVCRSSFLSLLS